MDGPKVDEALKEQLRKEYADFDIDSLLSESGQKEEEKKFVERTYTINESKQQMHSLFSQLQDVMSNSKATALPSTDTVFGGEAIQPLQPPLFFGLGEDERNFETGVGPWRQSRD